MRCDMVVAVGSATVEGQTLFGHNCALPAPQEVTLVRTRGRDFSLGEPVRTQFLELPQARRTYSVLAARPDGVWGYVHGMNEHGLSMGVAPLAPRLECLGPGLLGTDLVRLALERCRSARQAVDLLTGLLQQHGRAGEGLAAHDPAFLVADPHEAFAVESASGYWVEQEVCEVRAAGEVRVIRQDWDRIAPGFAELAIERGWWPADGTKLDFAGCLGESRPGLASGWRRWGRATILLEQQNGHIDTMVLRRLLSDHYEETGAEVDPRRAAGPVPLCQHALGPGREGTVSSFLAQVAHSAERLPLVWWAYGPPCGSLYFPLVLDGELPEALSLNGPESVRGRLLRLYECWQQAPEEQPNGAEELARLQFRFDQDAEEFAVEGAAVKARGDLTGVGRLATAFMQHTVERFEGALADLVHAPQSVAANW